jgi:hypothetical protein
MNHSLHHVSAGEGTRPQARLGTQRLGGERPFHQRVWKSDLSEPVQMATTTHQYSVTVVTAIRVSDDDCVRMHNLTSCLRCLSRQSLPKADYRLVLVEQDTVSRCGVIGTRFDDYILAYNPGPFNRSWGFNIAAKSIDTGVVCFLDADLLVPHDFLSRGLAAWRAGAMAIHPYTEILYLSTMSTQRVRTRLEAGEDIDPADPAHHGAVRLNLDGGCLWVDATLYKSVGGHDERFEGWGDEDREFWLRLSQATSIQTLPGRLLHLSHPRRAATLDTNARANRLLYRAIRAGLIPPQGVMSGDLDRYRRILDKRS